MLDLQAQQEAGVYTGCCDFTKWVYNCEEGCKQVFVGSGYTTEADCYAANPQWMGVGATVCGYECDPICEPCNPCYTINCGYPTSATCEMNCSCVTSCYVCDCLNVVNGTFAPCYGYLNSNNLADCPYWPVSSTGLDTWVPTAWIGVPTYLGPAECAKCVYLYRWD